jgi:hypothetical protein
LGKKKQYDLINSPFQPHKTIVKEFPKCVVPLLVVLKGLVVASLFSHRTTILAQKTTVDGWPSF